MKVSAGMGFVWLPAVRTKESASQHRQDVFTSFGSQKTSHGSRCTGNSVAKLPGDIRSQRLVPGIMLKDGAMLALALCCIVILRHGNVCLPPCLGRWRFESLEDLTAHFELLCSDPRDLAVAIAIYGMLTAY